MLFQKWQGFDEFWSKLIWALKSPQNVHFHMFFLLIFDLKKSRVIFHDPRESCKIWRKTDFCFQNDRWILIRALKSPKHVHFDMSVLVMFDLKKSSAVIFHDTRESCKIWRKTDFCFQKWLKFSPEHLKVSKLGLWSDSFVQSWKCMSLRFTGELCVMKMKNGAKIEEELTSQFKTDMNNLTNFDSSTQKSQKFAL